MTNELRWVKDFKCIHCRGYVSVDSLLSGVQNRNHCPYCLWSRHLDLYRAGDRLSACKASMQPVGLALKKSCKKYGPPQGGELMLIHRCTGCGSISINRIAADDIAENLYEIYADSLAGDVNLTVGLAAEVVQPLGRADRGLVRRRLFGDQPAAGAPSPQQEQPFVQYLWAEREAEVKG